MIELTIPFILSQISRFLALLFEFASLQFKERKYIYSILSASAIFISLHFFLLGEIAAGSILIVGLTKYITCIFSTKKKHLYIFMFLYTLVLIFTYVKPTDLLVYIGLIIYTIGNFQKDDRRMREVMIVGVSLVVLYNIVIGSPMGFLAEFSFLLSNIIGYYRHSIKNGAKKNKNL